jgi:hypothetical protein
VAPCQRSRIYSSSGVWSLTKDCAFLASWRNGTTRSPTILHTPRSGFFTLSSVSEAARVGELPGPREDVLALIEPSVEDITT